MDWADVTNYILPYLPKRLFPSPPDEHALYKENSRPGRRGGWTRAELHHGSILQFASVYTISRAVRTSGEAIEDPLKFEFLSSFRCKC